jgi:hypothetical protein
MADWFGDLNERVARGLKAPLNHPTAARETPTVIWQAKPKDGSVDWFQCDHPTEHNNPEHFDYRPLVPVGNIGALREALNESSSIIEWLIEDRDLDEMDRIRINQWSQLCQKADDACGVYPAWFDKVTRYEAALRKIADMCPATQEVTLAHQMAEEAEEALRGE